jgi:hypothetical protein
MAEFLDRYSVEGGTDYASSILLLSLFIETSSLVWHPGIFTSKDFAPSAGMGPRSDASFWLEHWRRQKLRF